MRMRRDNASATAPTFDAAPPPSAPLHPNTTQAAARTRWRAAIRAVVRAGRGSDSAHPRPSAAALALGALAGAGGRRAALRARILASRPGAARSRHDLQVVDALLRQCAPLAALARSVRHALARDAALVAFNAGEELCRGGAPVDRLIVVISGAVNVVEVAAAARQEGGGSRIGSGGGVQGVDNSSSSEGASPLRPACFGAGCVLAARAARGAGAAAAEAAGAAETYEATAVAAAAGRVEAMAVPAAAAARAAAADAAPDAPELAAMLRGLPALAWLPDAALAALASDAALRRYAPGQVVLQQGAPADAEAFLLSGSARALRALRVAPAALGGARALKAVAFRAAREAAYGAVLGAGSGDDGGGGGGGGDGGIGGSGSVSGSGNGGSSSVSGDGRMASAAGAPRRAQQKQQAHAASHQQPHPQAAQQAHQHEQQQQQPDTEAARPRLAPQLSLSLPADPTDDDEADGDAGQQEEPFLLDPVTPGGGQPAAADGSGGWSPLVTAIEAALRGQGRARSGSGAASAPRTPRVRASPPTRGLPTPRGRGHSPAVAGRISGLRTAAGSQAGSPRSVRTSPLAVAAARCTAGAAGSANAATTPAVVPSTARSPPGAARARAVRWSLATPDGPSDADPWSSDGGGGGGGAGRSSIGGGSVAPTPRRASSTSRRASLGFASDCDGAGAGLTSDPGGAAVIDDGGDEDERLPPEQRAWPRVVVELARLGQGQCFGDVRPMCGRGAARYSVVADAPCAAAVVARAALARALGPRLLRLFHAAAAPEGWVRLAGGGGCGDGIGGSGNSDNSSGGGNSGSGAREPGRLSISGNGSGDGGCGGGSACGARGGPANGSGGYAGGGGGGGGFPSDDALRAELVAGLEWDAFKAGLLEARRCGGNGGSGGGGGGVAARVR